MQAHDDPDGGLTVTHNSSGMSSVLIGLGLLLVGTAVYDYFIGPRGTDRLVGLMGGAGTCLLAGILTLETGRFRFDRPAQEVRWARRWGFRRRTGRLAFSDISRVLVEVPIGDRGIPSRRVCLRLADGSLVPIVVGYRPDTGNEMLQIAEKIRRVIGLDTPSTAQSAADLVAHGQTTAAVRLLVERDGLSLTAAKQRIDELKKR